MTRDEVARLKRPFAPSIFAKARQIASQYRLTIEADEDGGYVGSTVELPRVMGGGDSIAACARETMEATVAGVATLLEAGQRPPAPAREGRRDQQVNIRLTADEKLALEATSQREGFRSLSDYIRASALRRSD